MDYGQPQRSSVRFQSSSQSSQSASLPVSALQSTNISEESPDHGQSSAMDFMQMANTFQRQQNTLSRGIAENAELKKKLHAATDGSHKHQQYTRDLLAQQTLNAATRAELKEVLAENNKLKEKLKEKLFAATNGEQQNRHDLTAIHAKLHAARFELRIATLKTEMERLKCDLQTRKDVGKYNHLCKGYNHIQLCCVAGENEIVEAVQYDWSHNDNNADAEQHATQSVSVCIQNTKDALQLQLRNALKKITANGETIRSTMPSIEAAFLSLERGIQHIIQSMATRCNNSVLVGYRAAPAVPMHRGQHRHEKGSHRPHDGCVHSGEQVQGAHMSEVDMPWTVNVMCPVSSSTAWVQGGVRGRQVLAVRCV